MEDDEQEDSEESGTISFFLTTLDARGLVGVVRALA
jgi:hypothetical protein